MNLYRIVKTKARTNDLSGTGAYRFGGRWNSKGTYMLYTSETSSLALLENLVHFDPIDIPPHLFIMQLEMADDAAVYTLPDNAYPEEWIHPGLLECNEIGDKFIKEGKFLALRVRSAVNPTEYNYLLNPLFPHYFDGVKIKNVMEIALDGRLRIV
jgi:RES domain-containing protein